MKNTTTASSTSKRSRYGFAMFFFLSLVVVFTSLRVLLFVKFKPAGIGGGEVVQAFLIGLHRDVFAALVMTLPLLFWLWVIPNKWFAGGWFRVLAWIGFFFFWSVEVFLLAAEYFFFDEFKSRFNTVAVDYLLYPTEVIGNIRESYPVTLVVGICALAGLAWIFVAFKSFRGMWQRSVFGWLRFLYFGCGLFLSVLLWFSLNPRANILPSLNMHSENFIFRWIASRIQSPHFSNDRTLNEIANNGSFSFVYAALTRNLDYSANFKTIDKDEAYARVRKLLAEQGTTFSEEGQSIRRKIAGDDSKPRLNVVILMEESFGSEFWGSLGRPNTLTPEMDKLAADEGILFTNIYASGNRTVRGFEGILSSFPPLPGDSIVKRDRSENVETIARVLKRDGYDTVFFYGGRGLFDGMKSFTMNNGYDRFLEHNPPFHDDFPKATFTTAWGVCDEEVYARAIEEFRELNKTGKPFLGTVMSVSNHKPYVYPAGRIPEDPLKPKPKRSKVVKYSDWSLGQFFKAAKLEAFWTNTIFVVVADHGARVYGSQSIPIHSYEIPLLIAGPAVVKQPIRVPELGGSLDVSPTILGLLGRPYETLFFGRDLLKSPPEHGRAFLNHNRDIGMLTDNRLAVLGLMQSGEFYEGDSKRVNMTPLAQPTASDLELQKDAIAIYQVADDLYVHRKYRLDP